MGPGLLGRRWQGRGTKTRVGAADGPAAGIGCSKRFRAPRDPQVHHGERVGLSPSAMAARPASRSASPPGPPSAACCSIPSSSSAKPTWTARSGSRKARSPTCSRSCSARPPTACRRPGRGCNGALRFFYRRLLQFNRRRARGATSPIITISTAGSIRCSSTPTGNTPAPISRRPDQSLDDAQLAKKRHLAAKLLLAAPGTARARHRLRLGRACALSRRILPTPMSPASRCREEQWQRATRTRRGEEPRRPRSISACRTIATCGETFDRIVSVGMFEHVGVGFYDAFFRKCARAPGRRRRDAAAFDRPLGGPQRHQSLDRQIHLPRRLHPGAVGGAARDRARRPPGHRHRDPAPALRRDAASLARAVPGAPRGGRADLRRALRADVGVLSRRRRDGVPRTGA